MRLRTRLAAVFTGVVFSVLAAASVFFYFSQKAEILSQIRLRQTRTLASLVKVCEEAFLAREDIALLNYLRGLSANEDISRAAVVGTDGKILAHPDPAQIGETIAWPAGEPFSYAGPVAVQGREIGEARLVFNAGLIGREIEARAFASMSRFLKSVVLGAMLLGLLAAGLAAQDLARPIGLLAAGARRIGEGKLDHRIALERNDELGRLAAEFNRMARKLGELDRMKEEFVQSITHDLRSPLQSAMGHADMLLHNRNELTGRQAQSLEAIRLSCAQLNELIDQILDLAKLEAGMMPLKLAETDLAALAREVHGMFSAAAGERKLELVLDLKAEKALVSADIFLIRRVIANLVSNALKFTPKAGQVVLRVERTAEGFCCSVKDTGPGVPPEARPGLFRKFQQAAGVEASRGERGTGIGLALCKSTVEAHGGRIGLGEEGGKGSRFYFLLPAA